MPVQDKQSADKETREHITPFAFHVDEALFGLPLATPLRRGVGLLLDLIFVAMLAMFFEDIISLFVAIFFFIAAYRRRKKSPKKNVTIRYVAAGAFFLLIFLLSEPQLNFNLGSGSGSETASMRVPVNINNRESELSVAAALDLGRLLTGLVSDQVNNECVDLACYYDKFHNYPVKLNDLGLDSEAAQDFFEEMAESTNLPKEGQKNLAAQLLADFQALAPADEETSNVSTDDDDEETSEQADVADEDFSIIGWVKAGLKDLGISFGWSALYFTAFVAWFQGKTLGKWITGTRIIKLDGRPITLWESFGRYGGYGAGLATGLLGFLQVYWDPNRQGIQDKISGTVVIRE